VSGGANSKLKLKRGNFTGGLGEWEKARVRVCRGEVGHGWFRAAVCALRSKPV